MNYELYIFSISRLTSYVLRLTSHVSPCKSMILLEGAKPQSSCKCDGMTVIGKHTIKYVIAFIC